MGQWTSKQVYGGTLLGAYAPPISDVAIPEAKPGATYTVTVPSGKAGGDQIIVTLDGKKKRIKVPTGKQGGEKFSYQAPPDIRNIFASTLNQIPGMEIIQSKPVIFGTVICCFQLSAWQQLSDDSEMGDKVGELMQDAQTKILEEAAIVSCNAVLGMDLAVTIDSDSNQKVVIVTAYGTPCYLAAAANLPVIEASAVVAPLYNY